MSVRVVSVVALAAALCHLAPASVLAMPILQLYVEGATYDEATETWVYTAPGSSGGQPFRLWAIGNISGPGGKGTIYDVRLAAAYDELFSEIQITLTPTVAGGDGEYYGFTDRSTPLGTGDWIQTVTDGSTPLLGSGEPLPPHGVYGDGVHWQEFALGDFSLRDSPIADFIDEFPTEEVYPDAAQINAYDIVVSGPNSVSGATIHFDLYNHVEGRNKVMYRFAPFSHNAAVDAEVAIVPEPSTLALFGFGCLSMLGTCWMRPRDRKSQDEQQPA